MPAASSFGHTKLLRHAPGYKASILKYILFTHSWVPATAVTPIHGYSDLTKKAFDAVKVQLAESHPKKLETVKTLEGLEELRFPNCKPVRQGEKEVNELGFQYVMKTSARPEYSQGFTQEELDELKAKSDDHVVKLKSGAKDHCHARAYTGTAEEVHMKIHSDSIDFNKANGCALRPLIAMDTINIMLSHPKATDEWVRYIKRKTIKYSESF